MWKYILNFELKLGFKKTSVLVYFIVFFGLAFLIVNILGGAFTGARIVVGNANNNLNAPLVIGSIQTVFSIIGVLIFTGLTAYDTQTAKTIFIQTRDERYGIKFAISLYLNFINLFQMLLMLLGNRE